MMEEIQEIIDKKPFNLIETEEENCSMIDVLNLLVLGCL